ncbi:hypothetical protein AVEN_144765-1 [Araneus ventricosus]|uniref:Uncharacterized protein n=1 Tax=Araneus ventricosus TaxID=182803 RepID=A0A4Y2PVK6_ARAVE|nr:hypothetical protein AVEN_144765-1 [Araneus ventricosus]
MWRSTFTIQGVRKGRHRDPKRGDTEMPKEGDTEMPKRGDTDMPKRRDRTDEKKRRQRDAKKERHRDAKGRHRDDTSIGDTECKGDKSQGEHKIPKRGGTQEIQKEPRNLLQREPTSLKKNLEMIRGS